MERIRPEDYLPQEYSKPEEDHLFRIKDRTYQGFTYVADRSLPIFQILDIGDNFLTILREYYANFANVDLPNTKLFIIDSPDINAFAVYEHSLDSYCIGIFAGVCMEIEKNIRASLEKVNGVLFPAEEAEMWYDRSFVEALRFFVAHEYAHIICGHVTKEENTIHFEFADDVQSKEDNLFQQMKEFQADQMAMSFLCRMAYQDTQSQHNLRIAYYDQMEDQFWATHSPHTPPIIRKDILGTKREEFVTRSNKRMSESRHIRLKTIMAGVNIVFHTLDTRRKKTLVFWADTHGISQSERNTFFFQSGLSTMRNFDHPLPPIRLEAVSRIMGEAIEEYEPEINHDQLENDVMDFAWVVEVYRNEFNLGNLYCHIPHSPAGQDFIQEMETLWQEKKHTFSAYLPPLVRLFYANRIVDISDDGHLLR